MELKIELKLYQDRFQFSTKKFPCLISAIGTGKTYMFLLKIWSYCKQYPGTTALIVRKEYTDLKDSTMRDFEKYFNVKIGSDKDYEMPNGSKIMFRHASELDVLKNINLGIAGIEQAEEFEDDTQFQFIRDRMRQKNGADVRPICVIANANGHNWCWKTWINGALAEGVVNEIDGATGQYQYLNGEYDCVTANSFANADNLPADFVADLKRMEKEAPNHYNQYVMNSFEEMSGDDFVFNFPMLMEAKKNAFAFRQGYGYRVLAYDIARYGNDKCAAVGLHQIGALHWSMFHAEQWDHKDLDYTTGRILSISNQTNANDSIIDEDGLGSGPLDFIQKGRKREDFKGFRNTQLSFKENKDYGNCRTLAAFKAKDYIQKGWIGGLTEELIQELMTIRYRYTNDGRKELISKEVMRNKYKIKSPNLADAFFMAISVIGTVKEQQNNQYYYHRNTVSKEENLFSIAGIR